MGMLFNTPGTLALLAAANDIFSGQKLINLRNDPQVPVLINRFPAPGSLHDFTNHITINGHLAHAERALNIPRLTDNFSDWCRYWETHKTQLNETGGIASIALGAAITRGLQGPYVALEFFAVPSDGRYIDVTYYDSQEGGKHTLAITIISKTIDVIHNGG